MPETWRSLERAIEKHSGGVNGEDLPVYTLDLVMSDDPEYQPVGHDPDAGVVKLANGRLYRTIAWEEYVPAFQEHLEEKQVETAVGAATDTMISRASPDSDGDDDA